MKRVTVLAGLIAAGALSLVPMTSTQKRSAASRSFMNSATWRIPSNAGLFLMVGLPVWQ